ncbi:MAG: CHAT domain-containing protein [Bacteroidetes bacterium]|nr:CHAT domain-containing protein [Bacteroidota bacterium]
MNIKSCYTIFLICLFGGMTSSGMCQEKSPVTAEEWYQFGREEFKNGNVQEAITAYKTSGEISLKETDYEGYVKTLCAIGACYNSVGFKDKFIETVNHGKEMVKAHPDDVSDCLKGRLTNLSAIIHTYEKQDSMVLVSYYEAAKYLTGCEGGFKTDLAGVWINIGYYYYQRGFFDQAEPFYKKGLNALIEMGQGDHPFAATAYHNLSRLYRILMESEIALEYLQKAIDIRSQIYSENHPYVASSYQTLGFTYQQLNQYEKAEFYQKKVLEIYKNLNLQNTPVELSAQASYGSCLIYLERYTEAEQYLLYAINKLEEEFPDEEGRLALIYTYLAKCYYYQGKSKKALEYAEKSRQVHLGFPFPNQENLKITEGLLTELYLHAGDSLKAEAIFDQTIEELWPEDGDLSVIPAKKYLLSAFYSKGMLFYKRKEYEAAEEMIEKGLEILQAIILNVKTMEDKSFYLETTTSLFKLGMRVEYELFRQNKNPLHFEHAFRIAELHKSHLLTEFLNNQKAITYAGIPLHLIQKEEEIRNYLNYYQLQAKQTEQNNQHEESQNFRVKAAELQRTHDSLLIEITLQYPRYAQIRLNSPIIGMEDVRKKLIKRGTALVEYFWDKNDFFVLTIERNKLSFIKIDRPSAIIEDMEEYLTLISDQYIVEHQAYSLETIKEIERIGYQLYSQLLAPAISPEIKELIIIPDGLLGYLPFDNLITQTRTSDSSYRNLHYLWKKAVISYGFSANLLSGDLTMINRNNRGLIGFAPGFSGNDSQGNREIINNYLSRVTPLIYNQIEVENIAKIWGGEVFKGEKATEAAFRKYAPGKKILHLAMHALINDSLPAFSGLLFKQTSLDSGSYVARSLPQNDSVFFPSDNDGLLTASEIYGLDLKADLVVLSACNTGLGRHKKGEGIMSLARAFAYAGCPNIIMTLWQADDEATSVLMEYFYGFLKEGYSKGEALQKARFAFLDNHDQTHPYYWGSFVLMGDPSPVKSSGWWIYLLAGIGLLLLVIGVLFYWRRKD